MYDTTLHPDMPVHCRVLRSSGPGRTALWDGETYPLILTPKGWASEQLAFHSGTLPPRGGYLKAHQPS